MNYSNSQWRTRRGAGIDPATGFTLASGGDCAIYTASGTLLVGDVVYFSGNNTVAKTNVAATYAAFAGVVVGGESLNDFIASDEQLASATQATAATNGKRVIVQYTGDAHVIGGVTCAAGVAVAASAVTAGRVTTVGVAAGQTLGTMVVGNDVGTNGVMRIAHR